MLIYVATLDHAGTLYNAESGVSLSVFSSNPSCNTHYRRALSDKEKKCYINAVKCMQTLPARNTSRPQSWTRFDEFQSTHIGLAPNIHYVVTGLSGSSPTHI